MSGDAAYLLRFGFLESVIDGDPHLVSTPAAIATLRGLSLDEYTRIRTELATGVARVVSELLEDQLWRGRIRALPWRGKNVVIAGDSITADLQSWGRILQCAHERLYKGDAQIANLAIDGNTSAGLLTQLPAITAHNPDEVLVMIGTNDGQCHANGQVAWISDDETQRNLSAVSDALRGARARVSWLAPPRVNVQEIKDHWYLGDLPIGWSAERHEAKRRLVIEAQGFAIDIADAIGAGGETLLDGLHPSLEGHRRIAEEVLTVFSSASL